MVQEPCDPKSRVWSNNTALSFINKFKLIVNLFLLQKYRVEVFNREFFMNKIYLIIACVPGGQCCIESSILTTACTASGCLNLNEIQLS